MAILLNEPNIVGSLLLKSSYHILYHLSVSSGTSLVWYLLGSSGDDRWIGKCYESAATEDEYEMIVEKLTGVLYWVKSAWLKTGQILRSCGMSTL